ncbi:hypothetical protein CCM_03465 [Cordyceps militaris CM01]|uniref:Uncharacterized protein n=1 Tax=Cordyceps militaris (strain CM01) TaxID=983644 RepID=G3JAY1_CORMM|nr:uncharacterized protein CCM_03465 [Cordyceps militaris CM01]EGX95193.1 hypothetical protein CCM_03465 [Cordyceps militaris CM01]
MAFMERELLLKAPQMLGAWNTERQTRYRGVALSQWRSLADIGLVYTAFAGVDLAKPPREHQLWQARSNVAVDACFGIRRKAGCRLCFTGAGVWPLRSNERRQVVHGWRGYHDMSKTISVTTKIADEPHVAVQGEFQRI